MRIVDAHCTIGDGRNVSMSADELVRQLDELDVEAAIVGPPDRCLAVYNREGNELVRDACARHAGRLIGFATVNPWYGDAAVDELRRAIDDGLAGLILHPPLQGYILVDSVADAVLDVAGSAGLPVFVGTGTPAYALPLQLTEVARRHPDVRFVMGHLGHSDFWIEAIPAAAAAPNIYADISYTQPHVIAEAVATLGADRVVYGSDAPFNKMSLELDKLRQAGLDERSLELVGAGTILSLLPPGTHP
jgi:predicted TIM-barrel fold metal-dependent hydrolase